MGKAESLFEKVLPFASLNMAYESINFTSMSLRKKKKKHSYMQHMYVHVSTKTRAGDDVSLSGHGVYQRIVRGQRCFWAS